jgi:hypothetical protein
MCVAFRNKLFFLQCEVASPPPNPKAGGQPIVGCQYIRSYSTYLEAATGPGQSWAVASPALAHFQRTALVYQCEPPLTICHLAV